MRKAILFLFAVIASLVTVSCTKQEPAPEEQYKLIPMPVNQVCNYNSVDVQIFVRKTGYTLDSAFQVITPDGDAEIIMLGHPNKHVSACLMMRKNQIFHIETSPITDKFTFLVNDIQKEELVWQGTTEGDFEGPVLGRKKCREKTTNFGDCIKCAFKEMTDDWEGIISTLVFPNVVATSLVIHCRGHIGIN